MNKNIVSIDKYRSATLGKTRNFKTQTVEVDGIKFQVRQPTIAERGAIQTKSMSFVDAKGNTLDKPSFSTSEFQIWGVIGLTVIPGTNTKIFSPEDYDMLAEQPAGGWFDKLSKAAAELSNVEEKEVKKP